MKKDFEQCKKWILERMCKDQTVESVTGSLAHFLTVPHEQLEEHHVCLQSFRYSDQILFNHEGDGDAKAETMDIDSGEQVAEEKVVADLLGNLADQKKAGRNTVDGKTGASLKLTVLKDEGRVWTVVARRGESVLYAHTVVTTVGDENWRIMESTFGASSTVAATFATVVKVLEDSILEFKEYSFQIWIRRLGPNYLDRLRRIEAVGWRFGLPLEECGPETHIAAVLPMALEMQPELAEADSAVS